MVIDGKSTNSTDEGMNYMEYAAPSLALNLLCTCSFLNQVYDPNSSKQYQYCIYRDKFRQKGHSVRQKYLER